MKAANKIAVGSFVALAFCSALIFSFCRSETDQASPGELPVSLDDRGPYLILHTVRAGADYAAAISLARNMHPGAPTVEFKPDDVSALAGVLKEFRPVYCLIFLGPFELDVNLAWKWLGLAAAVDDDPFVDVRAGFITGENPQAVLRFVKRISDALERRVVLPAAVVDNLGPNEQMKKGAWAKFPGSFMIPALAEAFPMSTISHGPQGFTEERFGEMSAAGLVHFGGHGFPDRVEGCLNGPFVRRVPFAPSVVFNGACYTGVTGRWFDVSTGSAQPRTVPVPHSFALGVLSNKAVAYLASLHPDHGIPVYQEMEYLAYTGASLGDVMKHTHDGVILAAGGSRPSITPLREGAAVDWTPAEVMLMGTASRVLFGDPALKIMDGVTEPPLEVSFSSGDGRVIVTARVKNPGLKTTFSDTYFSDLSRTGQFNDRLLISCEWPRAWRDVGDVVVDQVTAGGEALPHRLVGWAFEEDGGRTRLHVQVDILSTGYLESPLRTAGAECRIAVRRLGFPLTDRP